MNTGNEKLQRILPDQLCQISILSKLVYWMPLSNFVAIKCLIYSSYNHSDCGNFFGLDGQYFITKGDIQRMSNGLLKLFFKLCNYVHLIDFGTF